MITYRGSPSGEFFFLLNQTKADVFSIIK